MVQMGLVEISEAPESSFFGRVGRKFPARTNVENSWNDAPKWDFEEFSAHRNPTLLGEVLESVLNRTEETPKHSIKCFGDTELIFGLSRVVRVKNRWIWPKVANFRNRFQPKLSHTGVRRASKKVFWARIFLRYV